MRYADPRPTAVAQASSKPPTRAWLTLLCPPKDGAEIFERLESMTPSCLKRPLTRAGKRWKAKEEAMDREAETVPEEAEDFKFARQQHPAVESAINNLEQRGLDCVRTRGTDGLSGRVVDSRAESALGRSDRSGGDCDAQLLFPIVPFRLAQLAFRARTLEIGSTAGAADTCICNFRLAAVNGGMALPLAQNRRFSGGH